MLEVLRKLFCKIQKYLTVVEVLKASKPTRIHNCADMIAVGNIDGSENGGANGGMPPRPAAKPVHITGAALKRKSNSLPIPSTAEKRTRVVGDFNPILPPITSGAPLTSKSESIMRKNHPQDTLLLRTRNMSDMLYGSIEIEGKLFELIDTPPFQRLYYLRQLGVSHYGSRGAVHTRFQHSLGTAHLAKRQVTSIIIHQPYLKINEQDAICVEIAALMHDIGHGPYSHVFDSKFNRGMPHELRSVEMFKHMLKCHNIDLKKLFNLEDIDLVFIEELILGKECKERKGGRGEDKSFLYDIVNNCHSGLDVDKMDYLRRDGECSGHTAGQIKSSTIDRFISTARVCWAPDENGKNVRMICYPEDMAKELAMLGRTRKELHELVYQSLPTLQMEYLYADVLIEAHKAGWTKRLSDGTRRTLAEADDPAVLLELNDSVLEIIGDSDDPKLEYARSLIKRVNARDGYKCVYDIEWPDSNACPKALLKEALERPWLSETRNNNNHHNGGAVGVKRGVMGEGSETEEDNSDDEELSAEFSRELFEKNLICDMSKFHCGKGDKDPVSYMRFYRKFDKAFQDSERTPLGQPPNPSIYKDFMPHPLQRCKFRVFTRKNEIADEARKLLERWAEWRSAESKT